MRIIALLALPLLLTTALAQEAPKAEAPKEFKPSASSPQTDLILRMFKTGKQKLHFWCHVHADAKVGQQWVIRSTTTAGTINNEFFTAWQVVKVDGDLAIVEYDNGRGFIAAFEVDLTKKPADIANVKRAWVAKAGETPEAATVAETPKAAPEAKDKPAEDAPKPEEFKDLELAGQKWSGVINTSKTAAWETKSWFVEGAWFGGVIKTSTTSGKAQSATELHSTSTTAKAWLKWEDLAKEEPKPEAKPEDKKPQEGK